MISQQTNIPRDPEELVLERKEKGRQVFRQVGGGRVSGGRVLEGREAYRGCGGAGSVDPGGGCPAAGREGWVPE